MPSNDLLLGGLVSNLLALPRTLENQAQQQQINRMLLQKMAPTLGLTDQQVTQMTPEVAQFPGMGVPVLGSVLRGVGTAGQILQNVIGARPSAPRPDLGALTRIAQMDTKLKTGKTAAQAYETGGTTALGKTLLEQGEIGAATKFLAPRTGASTINALVMRRNDPATSQEERQRLDQNIAEMQRLAIERQAAGAGASAEARQDVTLPSGPMGLAARELGIDPRTASPEDYRNLEAETIRIHDRIQKTKTGAAKTFDIAAAHSALNILHQGRDALNRLRKRGVVTDSIWNLPIQAKDLYQAYYNGDSDAAFLLDNFRTAVPQIARAYGEVRTNQLEERRIARTLSFALIPGVTGQNIIDNYIRIIEGKLAGAAKVANAPPPPEGTSPPPDRSTEQPLPEEDEMERLLQGHQH